MGGPNYNITPAQTSINKSTVAYVILNGQRLGQSVSESASKQPGFDGECAIKRLESVKTVWRRDRRKGGGTQLTSMLDIT